LELDHKQHCNSLFFDYSHHWAGLDTVRMQIMSNLFPWLQTKSEEHSIPNLVERYKQAFGDVDSPEMQESINNLLYQWKKRTNT